MKIKNLREVACSEIQFQKRLSELKNEIQKARNPKLYIDSIKKELEKECKLIYELDSVNLNDNYYLSSVSSFCICVLTQFLIDSNNTYKYKINNAEQLYENKIDIKKTKKEITEDYLKYIYEMFENGFGTHEYNKDFSLNQDFLHKLNILLSILHLSIVEKLVGVKPHIFIADNNGHCAVATTISIVVDQNKFFIDNEIDMEKLFLTIINVITECVITRLFKQILTVFDITKLQEIYNTTNEIELKNKIGKDIAQKIVDNSMTVGLKTLLECTKEHFNILKNL